MPPSASTPTPRKRGSVHFADQLATTNSPGSKMMDGNGNATTSSGDPSNLRAEPAPVLLPARKNVWPDDMIDEKSQSADGGTAEKVPSESAHDLPAFQLPEEPVSEYDLSNRPLASLFGAQCTRPVSSPSTPSPPVPSSNATPSPTSPPTPFIPSSDAAASMHHLCLHLRSGPRRSALRRLNFANASLDDAALSILGRWILGAPTDIFPLRLHELNLSDNGVWARGVAKVLRAAASNPHASVESLRIDRTHLGVIPSLDRNASKNTSETDQTSSNQESQGHSSAGAPHGRTQSPASGGRGSSGGINKDRNRVTSPNNKTDKDHSSNNTTPTPSPTSASSSAVTLPPSPSSLTCFGAWALLLRAPHVGLRHLSLRCNNLGDLAVGFLAAGLRQNTTLLSIDLEWNDVGVSGVRALAAALGGRRIEEKQMRLAMEAEAALATSQDDDESRPPSGRTSRNSKASSKAAGATTGAKGGKGSKAAAAAAAAAAAEEAAAIPPRDIDLSIALLQYVDTNQSPSDPSTSAAVQSSSPTAATESTTVAPTNHSVTSLNLRHNPLTSEALHCLLSAVRHNPNLKLVSTVSNTHALAEGVPVRASADFKEMQEVRRIQAQIDQACTVNRNREPLEKVCAFLLGFHARAGGRSSIRKVLLQGAIEQVNARTDGMGMATSSNMRHSTDVIYRSGTSSRVSSATTVPNPLSRGVSVVEGTFARHPYVPQLSFEKETSSTMDASTSSGMVGQHGSNAPIASISYENDAAPHLGVLKDALSEVWSFVGLEALPSV